MNALAIQILQVPAVLCVTIRSSSNSAMQHRGIYQSESFDNIILDKAARAKASFEETDAL
jgi:hypothetical protein